MAIRNRIASALGRGGDGDDDDESIGQLEARIERARQEARAEARTQQRRERVQQAREQARAEALDEPAPGEEPPGTLQRIAGAVGQAVEAVDDGDRETFDDFEMAMQTDFDGDGDPFANELGLAADRETEQTQAFAGGLANEVRENSASIDLLENELGQQRSAGGGGLGGGPPAAGGGIFAPPDEDPMGEAGIFSSDPVETEDPWNL
jgi:hypothetical protein